MRTGEDMDIKDAVVRLFETEYMRGVVGSVYDELGPLTIAEIVTGSRAPLEQKAELLGALAEGDDFYAPYRDALGFALAEMQVRDGERAVYQVSSYWMESAFPYHDFGMPAVGACHPTFDAAMADIKIEIAEEGWEDKPDGWRKGYRFDEPQEWYQVEKFVFAERGTESRIRYWVGCDGVARYFSCDQTPFDVTETVGAFRGRSFFKCAFWPGPNNMPTGIPLPLEPGDVVSFDSLPHMWHSYAVVSDNGHPSDCCLPQAVYRGVHDELREGAIKHGHAAPEEGQISPLYRLEPARDPLCLMPESRLGALLHEDGGERFRKLFYAGFDPGLGMSGWTWRLKRGAGRAEPDLDPLSFVDSAFVRENFVAVGWEPGPLEAAFLVWQSRSRSVRDKHAAWRRIVEAMPDVPVPARRGCDARPSLHGFLKDYMGLERRVLSRAEGWDDHSCWQVRPRYRGVDEVEVVTCRTLNDALDEVMSGIDDGDWELHGERPRDFAVSQVKFNDPAKEGREELRLRYSPDLELMGIEYYRYYWRDEKAACLWGMGFSGMWFDFPLPFRTGDVLRYCDAAGFDERFVLVGGLSPELRTRLSEDGDSSDMTYSGYTVGDDGVVLFHAHFPDYLRMEPLTGELYGYDRKLRPLSLFAKGEIDLPECMRRCDEIGAEVRRELDSRLLDYQRDEIEFQFGECVEW